MKQGMKGTMTLAVVTMWVMVAACDSTAEAEPTSKRELGAAANVVIEYGATRKAETRGEGEADGTVIDSTSFELEAVTELVRAGELESAVELELAINDPKRGYNRIDTDADGTIDHVRVVEIEVEREAEPDVVLELRAVPSSTHAVETAVTFATMSFLRHPLRPEVGIETRYTAVVRQPDLLVFTRAVPVEIDAGVVVDGNVFLSWVFAAERPIHVADYVVDDRGRWIPPGHAKHRRKGRGVGKGKGSSGGKGKA